MKTELLFYLVPLASLAALIFARYFFKEMMKESEGTPRMMEIASYVRSGAMAYLRQQYKVVTIVFIVIAIFFAILAYGFGVQNEWVPFAFLTGGFFSGLAGFIGMKTATYASARTANVSRKSLNGGLRVAFRSGAVMGLVVVGLGLLDISVWYILLDNFSTAYVYTSKDNKSEPKTRILSIITYDKKSYEKDCKANEISSIDGNKIFSPVKNKPYSVEIAGVLSIDHDACERIARKSHNLYRKIRLEFEREFTKGIWIE